MQLEDLIPPPIEAAPRYPTGPAVDEFLLRQGFTPGIGDGVARERAEMSQDIEGEEPIMSAGRPKPEHKGMFGVKGTLRDILGIIGDAYSGENRYANIRRQERMGDAARGFQDDPRGSIDRLNAEGFAKEAMELYELHQKQQQAAAKLAREQGNDEITRLSGLSLAQNRMRAGVRGLLNSAVDDATYERLLPIVKSKLSREGLGMADEFLSLPSTFSGNEEIIRRWGMDPYQSESLVDRDETRAVQEELGRERIGATIRGQDVSAATQRRGQDMTDARVRGSAGYTGSGRKGGRTPPPPPPGMKWVKKTK